MSKSSNKKNIVVTQGDPFGIGPEIIVKSLSDKDLRASARWIVIGDRKIFSAQPGFGILENSASVVFVDEKYPGNKRAEKIQGINSLNCLNLAVDLIKKGVAHALVTAPISKANMYQAGFKFPGHTEYLAQAFGVKKHAMLLFADTLRVIPVTIHEPLMQVGKILSRRLVEEKIMLAHEFLVKHPGIKKRRIAVCALNPHAGEDGRIGREEKKIIMPAILSARKKLGGKVEVSGPHAADALFSRIGEYDLVIGMYHDQVLIPLKMAGFHQGVNMTLGLPFVRTSPDHGTAFDIAGKNLADPRSMRAALRAVLA